MTGPLPPGMADAEQALTRMRAAADVLQHAEWAGTWPADPAARQAAAVELAEAVTVLDTHLTLGGIPPASWAAGRRLTWAHRLTYPLSCVPSPPDTERTPRVMSLSLESRVAYLESQSMQHGQQLAGVHDAVAALGALTVRVDALDAKVDALTVRVDQRFAAVEGRLTVLEDRMGSLDANMTRNNDLLSRILAKLEA